MRNLPFVCVLIHRPANCSMQRSPFESPLAFCSMQRSPVGLRCASACPLPPYHAPMKYLVARGWLRGRPIWSDRFRSIWNTVCAGRGWFPIESRTIHKYIIESRLHGQFRKCKSSEHVYEVQTCVYQDMRSMFQHRQIRYTNRFQRRTSLPCFTLILFTMCLFDYISH